MSELITLSFDSDATPRIHFEKQTRPQSGPVQSAPIHGWGVGWYPASERGALVLKDPGSKRSSGLGSALMDWERFSSTLFLCHLRGHRRRRSQQDLQPFTRSYGGRHWVFAHDGDLQRGWAERLPLGDDPALEPLGQTDSEHAFHWILARLHEQRKRSLAEIPAQELHSWFRDLNQSGQLNVSISDGDIVAVYRDAEGRGNLWWTRLIPPHPIEHLESEAIRIDLDAPEDLNRTVLVFSSSPLSTYGWQALEPSQLMLGRRGSLVWDSAVATTNTFSMDPGIPASPSGTVPSGPVRVVRPPSRLLQIVHETVYTYDRPVERSTHRILLNPLQDKYQRVESFELQVEPSGVRVDFDDVFGNEAVSLEIDQPYERLRITGLSTVRVKEPDPAEARSARTTIPLVWMPWQRQMLSAYLLPAELPQTQLEELSTYAMSFVKRNDSKLIGTLLDLNETIFRDFSYVSGSTTVASTPFDVYQSRKGVCQDFANLMICLARLLSVPARYRMGYIYTGADYENKIQSEASHAWVELYLPHDGWHGFDPTNGCQVGSDHVRIACGRNYLDATPTTGTIYRGGGTETLQIHVEVKQIEE